MARSALPRRRREDAPQPAKPPIRIAHEKKDRDGRQRPPSAGRIRAAKDSNEIIRVPRKSYIADRPSVEDDPNARHFTVANVGAGGTLYLKPSRLPPSHFTQPPATPPDTSDGETVWIGGRHSNASGTLTPRQKFGRSATYDASIPVPPLSLVNAQTRRRLRSHSFSTFSDRVRSQTLDSSDPQLSLNGEEVRQRPKSSVDLSRGILELHIPHYRLGTPRFSDRGTAYLHSSVYTSTTDDMRSSVFSRAEYDKLFPVPPGKARGASVVTRYSSSPYLHPSHATSSLISSRTPPTPPVKEPPPGINAAIYDQVETNVNDTSVVRYTADTGRIVAATPARLIAQITSPVFLDYELLSDFFLTFRSFLPCRDLLEHLLARMRWALGQKTDAGRIVRVRTFVALRHWILNYFGDDWSLDLNFRKRFCDLVNDLAKELRKRPDQGGSDLKIVGELKKCWRRTCATFWPTPDALNTSAEADIVPGAESAMPALGGSANSLPLAIPPRPSIASLRYASVSFQEPADPEKRSAFARESAMQAMGPNAGAITMRTASIPASPMSEQSLQVLSCSVPFLRHMMSNTKTSEKNRNGRPAALQRNPQLSEKPSRPLYRHKRSASSSDALRDASTPLPSNTADSVDIQALSAITFTGGLVRGLLLQPSPAELKSLVPISPGLEAKATHFVGNDASHSSAQNAGMKRMFVDVRRALSARKPNNDSSLRSHRSTPSSDSQSSSQADHLERPSRPTAWQQLHGPPRKDLLCDRIGKSYKQALEDAERQVLASEQVRQLSVPAFQDFAVEKAQDVDVGDRALEPSRWNSHVTTGSRSILIMDDTNPPEMPLIMGALPSVSSMSSEMTPPPLFGDAKDYFKDVETHRNQALPATRGSSVAPGQKRRRSSAPAPIQDTRYVHAASQQVNAWDGRKSHVNVEALRKSSNVHPFGVEILSVPNQLRRRPGGDLKAADHVHELEPIRRPHTSGSLSTLSWSQNTSIVHSHDLSGTHFSGQDFGSWRLSPHALVPELKTTSPTLLETHPTQPNMRPSFEAQVSHLKHFPDRSHTGVEDALLHLEGKASNRANSPCTGVDPGDAHTLALQGPDQGHLRVTNAELLTNSNSVNEPKVLSPRTETQGASIYHGSDSDEMSEDVLVESESISNAENQAGSDRSTAPVLPRSSQASKFPAQYSSPSKSLEKNVAIKLETTAQDQRAHLDRTSLEDSMPKSATSQGSFLLDDNQSLSDISTEIAAEDQPEDDSLGVRSFFFDDTIEDEDLLPHIFQAPPTPPSTVGPPPDQSSPDRHLQKLDLPPPERTIKEAASAPKLLTPHMDTQQLQLQTQQQRFHKPFLDLRKVGLDPAPSSSVHMPFVLAFESEVIAEQLTIIEKDALDEVDWKDLISMNWRQSPQHVRNWVDYLQSEECTGVDIVVARFNLVVKWVVSEIVMTSTPSERARCITKYVHIASHCHRFRNYASMYQITLALLSSDLARLHWTWSLVAPAEKQALERLEKLCQPLHNFHNLRAEMESSSLDNGCIPFIGLYTHDLMFNAQKPSRVDPMPPGREPLINFERYQTAASIVKSLLRLIEASSKYIFHPHPEVLSRCLWLAAMEDPEITARSRILEQ